MGTFSFDYVKTVTTGEGGMVITNSRDLYLRSEWYSDHGHDHNPNVGRALEQNHSPDSITRSDELQSALGLAQLRKLDYLISEQKKNKKVIMDALAAIPGVDFAPNRTGRFRGRLAFSFLKNRLRSIQNCWPLEGVDDLLEIACGTMFMGAFPQRSAYSKSIVYDPLYKGKIEYLRKTIPHGDIPGRTLVIRIYENGQQKTLDNDPESH